MLVPSPEPISIVESEAIKNLMEAGIIVIAAGGGGIPVVAEDGILKGIDAVIDKDLAAEKLASQIKADVLLILSDVDFVYLNYGKEGQRELKSVSAKELERYQKEGHFPAGSMGPKVEAAIRFVRNGGKETIITSIEKAWEALNGETGTHVHA